MPIDGERGQELGDLHRSHLRRLPLVVTEAEHRRGHLRPAQGRMTSAVVVQQAGY